MDWTKIKAKHFLYAGFTLLEHGALSRLLVLTASLERLPTQQEMLRHVPGTLCKKLASTLETHRTTLPDVLQKVLEDVEGVQHKRSLSRSTTQRYREKNKIIRKGGDTSRDTTDKIREDKRREEKNSIYVNFEKLTFVTWNSLCEKTPILSKIRSISPKRRSHLKQRFTNKDFVDNWGAVLEAIPTCPFLLGKNTQKWVVDFDFLIRNDENYQKILEGKYGDKKRPEDRAEEIMKKFKEG